MGCGTLFVNVNEDDNGLCEVFANLGKAGGCPAQSEATCRIVSAALRSGVDPKVLIEQLRGIRCLSTISRRKENKEIKVRSCPDAIGMAIEESLGENCEPIKMSLVNKCPECGYPLRRDSGEKLLTHSQAADYLAVTPEQNRNLIRRGRLSAINVGTGAKRPLYRIRRQALEDFLSRRWQSDSEMPKKKFRQLAPVPDFFPHLK
jgi:excisionase family DNA binding protein